MKLGFTLRDKHRLRVFNTVLKKTVGHTREKITGEWRKLRDEKLHNLYSPLNIRMIRAWRMRCVGHMAYTGGREMHTDIWRENLERQF
jgi:hypothetical protein